MKSTGIVRKVDDLGRVVLPVELRRKLGINEKDPIEIFVDKEGIVLKKFTPNMTCAVTGQVSESNHQLLDGKLILSNQGAEELIKEIQLRLWKKTVE